MDSIAARSTNKVIGLDTEGIRLDVEGTPIGGYTPDPPEGGIGHLPSFLWRSATIHCTVMYTGVRPGDEIPQLGASSQNPIPPKGELESGTFRSNNEVIEWQPTAAIGC